MKNMYEPVKKAEPKLFCLGCGIRLNPQVSILGYVIYAQDPFEKVEFKEGFRCMKCAQKKLGVKSPSAV